MPNIVCNAKNTRSRPCSVSAFLLIVGIRLAFVFTCRVSLVFALIFALVLASLVKTKLSPSVVLPRIFRCKAIDV